MQRRQNLRKNLERYGRPHICVQLLPLLNNIASCCQSAASKQDLKERVPVTREVKCSRFKDLHTTGKCSITLHCLLLH